MNDPPISNTDTEPSSEAKGIGYGILGFLMLLVAISLLWAYITQPPIITRNLAPDRVYFVILVPAGLAVGLFGFGLARSIANIRGRAVGATYEFAGPVAATIGILVAGYWLPGGQKPFDMTLRVRGPNGVEVGSGKVTVELGRQTLSYEIGSNGDCEIKEIPPEYLNESVRVRVAVPGYIPHMFPPRVILDKTGELLLDREDAQQDGLRDPYSKEQVAIFDLVDAAIRDMLAGHYDASQRKANQVLNRSAAIKDNSGRRVGFDQGSAAGESVLGGCAQRQEDPEGALRHYSAVDRYLASVPAWTTKANNQLNIGNTLVDLGRYAEGRSAYDQAKDFLSMSPDTSEYAAENETIRTGIKVSIERVDIETDASGNTAARMKVEIQDDIDKERTDGIDVRIGNLAECFLMQGDAKNAIWAADLAIKYNSKPTGEKIYEASNQRTIAEARLNLDELSAARASIRRAISMFSAVNQKVEVRKCFEVVALIRFKEQNPEDAIFLIGLCQSMLDEAKIKPFPREFKRLRDLKELGKRATDDKSYRAKFSEGAKADWRIVARKISS